MSSRAGTGGSEAEVQRIVMSASKGLLAAIVVPAIAATASVVSSFFLSRENLIQKIAEERSASDLRYVPREVFDARMTAISDGLARIERSVNRLEDGKR